MELLWLQNYLKGKFQGRELPNLSVTGRSDTNLKLKYPFSWHEEGLLEKRIFEVN